MNQYKITFNIVVFAKNEEDAYDLACEMCPNADIEEVDEISRDEYMADQIYEERKLYGRFE